MARIVSARDGDSLCGIAIDAGFLDCTPLRAEPANSALLSRPLVSGDQVTVPDLTVKEVPKGTNNLHKFTKKNAPPVSVRFVHGSKDKKYLEDSSQTVLNVSNFPTNRAGNAVNPPFPSANGFNAAADRDIDAFKVEVVDPGASGSVNTVLEALKPVKQPDGTTKHEPITGVPDAGLRKMDPLACKQVSASHVAFRSPYLRLVVDKQDHDAAPKQTLLTADAVDAGDETLEILGQHVRATYEFSRCPGSPKCKAVAELPVGEGFQRAKVAVHILQAPGTNTPVATFDEARKSVLKYVRQLYAQANMSVKIVGTIRNVPAPANLIAIADAKGVVAGPAIGGGTIQVQVQVGDPKKATFDFDKTVQIVTTAGAAPVDTANTLAAAINAAFSSAVPPFAATATPSGNPPLDGQAIGGADVIVGDPLTQSIQLSVITNGDTAHPVTIGSITSTTIPDFADNESHVGTIEERTIVKNYDTGSDRIDLFIVGALAGAFGEAFIPNAALATARQPIAVMVNTVLLFADTVTKKDHFHTTIPHEMGHILMDRGHEVLATEMMGAGSPVGSNERVVNGPKRITDGTVAFRGGSTGDPIALLRTNNNTGVIDSF